MKSLKNLLSQIKNSFDRKAEDDSVENIASQKLVSAIFPIIGLLALTVILFATNNKPGTILSGWDNLHPEFDFLLNIRRSIFAVWQEHQGVGLLGGMAHATDLPRQIFLWFLSLFLETNIIRAVWTFIMLFAGSVGAYILSKDTVFKHNKTHILPFLAGTFYLLNLATIQMFYAPYESFAAFFAALPFLLFAVINYFTASKIHSKKSFLFLILILLLSIPAWYVQTFFVVFMMVLAITLGAFFFKNPTTSAFKKIVRILSAIFIINSFWLLPVAYFSINNSSVNVNSKINQMATENIIEMNKEFGTIPDVMLLKGFSYKSVDPDARGNVRYMLTPWRDHLENPLVATAGYLMFVIIFIGFIKSLFDKDKIYKIFSYLFIFSFIVLAIDTPPFSFINSILRNYVPLVNQIFRFPFTKFATLASLVYAILFAIGIREIQKKLAVNSAKVVLPFVLFGMIIAFSLPAFRGSLFYDKEWTSFPKEYFDLFSYFKKQDPNTRIADFPQVNFWGWNFYNWQDGSYGGSGFLWYGINQPILNRNFDVWSHTNENYYYEISQALFSKDTVAFEKVLNKYQAHWIIIDKNIFDPSTNKALFIPELEEMIGKIPSIKKVEQFGKIEVYKVDLLDKPKNFVFASKNLPVVNSYNWGGHDKAYEDLGNYIANTKYDIQNTKYYFPFRTLFTQKTQKEMGFDIKESKSTIDLSSSIPPHPKTNLVLPSFSEKEKIIPVQIRIQNNSQNTPSLYAKILFPEVYVDGKKVNQNNESTLQMPLPQFRPDQYPLKVNANGVGNFSITKTDQEVGIIFFNLESKNIITVSDKEKHIVSEVAIDPQIFNRLAENSETIPLSESKKEQEITVKIPKIDDSYLSFHPVLNDKNNLKNCDNFRQNEVKATATKSNGVELSSLDATACVSYFAQSLPHDLSYAIFIKSRNIKGQSMRFWVENTASQFAPIDTFLSKDRKTSIRSFILPSMESYGISYAFHFYNSSVGRSQTINEIEDFSVYPVFENYLSSIVIQNKSVAKAEPIDLSNMQIDHPNESLYTITNLPTTNDQRPTTLILSQAYDKGWKAYQIANSQQPIANSLKVAFPFIFGEEIKDHVMVNNWENGWNLNNSTIQQFNNETIILVYLPQYLQYAGFVLMLASGVALLVRYGFDKSRSF